MTKILTINLPDVTCDYIKFIQNYYHMLEPNRKKPDANLVIEMALEHYYTDIIKIGGDHQVS